MDCAVIIPVGPGHQQLAQSTITMALMNKTPKRLTLNGVLNDNQQTRMLVTRQFSDILSKVSSVNPTQSVTNSKLSGFCGAAALYWRSAIVLTGWT